MQRPFRGSNFFRRELRNMIGKGRSYLLSRLVDDIVYDSVFLSLLRIHDEIALYILFYLIKLLTAMLRM